MDTLFFKTPLMACLYGYHFFKAPLCPGESQHPWGDCLGKELRVLEHARRVAAVASRRGRRGGGVAALELEHRTEHRRKRQEGLRELHRKEVQRRTQDCLEPRQSPDRDAQMKSRRSTHLPTTAPLLLSSLKT